MAQEPPAAAPSGHPRESLEKTVLRPASREELAQAVEQAFDYRGDVMLTTRDGREIVGFVFNRVAEGAAEPYLEYFGKNEGQPRRLAYQEIVQIAFTGADPAAGRSWESWVRKNEEKKKALAEGRDIGNIEPEMMSLDD
jgi:hypothetical protein